MDLQATKAYMRGQRLSVDGQTYQLDGQGILRGVPPEVARVLLQGKDWLVIGGDAPAAAAAAPAPVAKPAPAAPVASRPAAPEANLPTAQLLPQPALAGTGVPASDLAPQPADEPFPAEDELPEDEQPAAEP